MIITALVCNSVYVNESVIREGEDREVIIERQLFCLNDSLKLKLSYDESGLRVCLTEGIREAGGMYEASGFLVAGDKVILLRTVNDEVVYLSVFFSGGGRNCLRYDCQGISKIGLGRASGQTICVTSFKLLSLDHMTIENEGTESFLNVFGRNGCYLNRYYIRKGERKKLSYSDEIILQGMKIIWLRETLIVIFYSDKEMPGFEGESLSIRLKPLDLCMPYPVLPGDLMRNHPMEDIHPIPRTVKKLDRTPVELDPPPNKTEIREESVFLTIGPAFTMAVPMALGSGLAIYGNKAGNSGGAFVYTGLITAISAALLGAMWALANLRRRKKEERRKERRRRKAYEHYINGIEERIRIKYVYNREALYYMYPSVESLMLHHDRAYLWNRLKGDEDYFAIRLGVGDNPDESVRIEVPRERFSVENDTLSRFPALLKNKYGKLKDVPILFDLGLDRLFGIVAERGTELEELVFLLIVQLCVVISASKLKLFIVIKKGLICESRIRMLRFLPHFKGKDSYNLYFSSADTEKLKEDLKMESEASLKSGSAADIIIFSDDYGSVKELKDLCDGIKIVLLAHSYNGLPGELSRIIQNDKSFRGIVNTRDSGENREIRFDRPDLSILDGFIRKLSSISMKEDGIHIPIPDKVLIEHIFDMPPETMGSAIADNWKRNNTIKSLKIPIGISEDRRIVYLDLHESFHGPHGLVAGMTGSGKSEMLQTIILSIAMTFSPEKASFFLIDYKGGGMAEMFKELPHLGGCISNLSGNNIYRAMVSIRSENERRQKLFLDFGVNRISEYEKKHIAGEVQEPLPHIFIIIDEFAELKKNEPEFMRELVSVAQVGRSLGVHLILATQKPQGTVDDSIWSNARFRICLRVQDKQDSQDMLHKPDAAFLKDAGRAYLQVGNDEIYEEFQSAYTMAVRQNIVAKDRMAFYDGFGNRMEATALRVPKTGGENGGETDFEIVKKLIITQTEALKLPYAKKLWMQELPDELEANRSFEAKTYTYCLGLYDAPRHQRQGDLTVSLLSGGHHIILGRTGSGKSTFLETLLYEFLIYENPTTLNAYVIDFSNGLLSGFSESLLLGAYFTEEDEQGICNLFYMLRKEVQKRKAEYKGINFAMKKELLEDVCAIALLIDNYGAFRQKTKEKYDESVQELLKNGEAYGIYIIITGDRVTPSDVPARVHDVCKSVICLSMTDRMNYSQSLRVLRCEVYPDEGLAGRGIAIVGSELLEFQTAVAFLGNEYDRRRKLRQLIEDKNNEYAGGRARPVPIIPSKPVLADMINTMIMDKGLAAEAEKGKLPVGYKKESGELLLVPFDKLSSFLVSGRKKSGKTNLLRVIKSTASFWGMDYSEADDIVSLKEALSEREGKRLLFIRNLSSLLEGFYQSGYEKELEAEVLKLISKNREKPSICIVFECSRDECSLMSGRKLFEALKEETYGIHLGGMINDQNFFEFSELSFTEKNVQKNAGEGNVPFISGELFSGEVIIPLWEETELMKDV
ncbi:MAG: FHA domain-containing protein [Lachnospiraceae bacterium]|nr:FHA domain-containing protein [Lachnospiraceae bacterium]